MAGMILDSDELFDLTKKKRFNSQVKQLKAMLIPFRRRADGSPVVTRAAVEGAGVVSDRVQSGPEIQVIP